MSIIPKGNGRVVPTLNDFENHVNGVANKHKATAIDLVSPLSINSTTVYTVETAVSTLNSFITTVSTTVPPDADGYTKGIVKLSGDFGGTAASPLVVNLRGRPLSNSSPSSGQALIYNGTTWIPTTLSTAFTAGNDLTGTAINQIVSSLTGTTSGSYQTSPATLIKANALMFDTSSSAIFTHQVRAAGLANGYTLSILGQPVTSGGGGNIDILGGTSASGRIGSVTIGTAAKNILEATTLGGIGVGQKILGIFNQTKLTSSEVPSNGGDGVIYIKNATTNPANSGSPIGGSVLYSKSGKLRVKQSDGYDIAMGSFVANPNVYGYSGKILYTYSDRVTYTTATNTLITPYAFGTDDGVISSGYSNLLTYVDAIVVASGFPLPADTSAAYKISALFGTTTGTTSGYDSNTIDELLPGFATNPITVPPALLTSSGILRVTLPATATGSDILEAMVVINVYALGVF